MEPPSSLQHSSLLCLPDLWPCRAVYRKRNRCIPAWRGRSHPPNIKHPLNGPNDVETTPPKPWFWLGCLRKGGRELAKLMKNNLVNVWVYPPCIHEIWWNLCLKILDTPFWANFHRKNWNPGSTLNGLPFCADNLRLWKHGFSPGTSPHQGYGDRKFGAGQYRKNILLVIFGKLQGPKMKHDDSNCLVVSTWLDYFPFHIWDVILPIDFHIFKMVKLHHQPVNNDQSWLASGYLT